MDKEFKNLKEIIELCKIEIEEKNQNINATLDYIDLKELSCLLDLYNQAKQEKEEHIKLEQHWHKQYQDTFDLLQQEKETSHHLQSKLDEANAVIDIMVEDMVKPQFICSNEKVREYIMTDVSEKKEKCKEYYFKKARGEGNEEN